MSARAAVARTGRRTAGAAVGVLLMAALAAPACAQARKEVITLDGSPPSPNALLSPAVRVGDLLFLSGSLGTVPGQGLVEGGAGPETRQIILNMQRSLEAAGATLDDLVKCTVFLADIADYGAMNEVYREMIPAPRPARSAVAVGALVLNAKVEIECIAAAPPR